MTLRWTIVGVAVFCVAISAAGAIAGPEYALAALIAGLALLVGASLWVANVRRKTIKGEDDPIPGIALDEGEMGDTPAHSDADDDEAVAGPSRRFQRLQRRESIEK